MCSAVEVETEVIATAEPFDFVFSNFIIKMFEKLFQIRLMSC